MPAFKEVDSSIVKKFLNAFPFLILCMLVLGTTSHATERFGFIETDNCYRLDFDLKLHVATITGICEPSEDDFFFKIYRDKEPAYLIFGKNDASSSNTDPEETFFDHPSHHLMMDDLSTQSSVVRFDKRGGSQRAVFHSDSLVKKLAAASKSGDIFNLFLVSSKFWISLEFKREKEAKSPLSMVPVYNYLQNIREHELQYDVALKQLFYSKLQSNAFPRCKPDPENVQAARIISLYKRPEEIKSVPDCTSEILLKKIKLTDIKQTPKASVQELKNEELIWSLILAANKFSNNIDLTVMLDSPEQYKTEEIEFFIAFELMKFVFNRDHSTRVIFEIYQLIFGEVGEYSYSLALKMNCDSFKGSIIRKAQAQLDKLHTSITAETFVNQRILYAIHRKKNLSGLGYVGGVDGIIGRSNDFDYCTNSNTVIDSIIIHSDSWSTSYKRIAGFMTVLRSSILMSQGITNFKAPTLDDRSEDPMLSYIKTKYKIFEAAKFALADKPQAAFEKWNDYLDNRYGKKIHDGVVSRADQHTYLQLLTLASGKRQSRIEEDLDRFLNFSANTFLSDLEAANSSFSYRSDYNVREGATLMLDALISNLFQIKKNEKADNLLFLLMQRRFLEPEKLALSRRLKPSRGILSQGKIGFLLTERSEIVDRFYDQLRYREFASENSREFLAQLENEYDKNLFMYNSDADTTTQLLRTNERILDPNVRLVPEFLQTALDHFSIQVQIKMESYFQKMFASNRGPVSNPSPEKFGKKYDPDIAVKTYFDLRKIDQNIQALNPKLFDILYDKPLSIIDIQSTLTHEEAFMMISGNKSLKQVSVFSISRDGYSHVVIERTKEVEICLENFSSLSLGYNGSISKCQKLLYSYLVPDEFLSAKNIEKLVVVLNGEMRNLPIAALPVADEVLGSAMTENPLDDVSRGITVTSSDEEVMSAPKHTYLIERFVIRHMPSVGSIKNHRYLHAANLKPSFERKFLGVGIGNFQPFIAASSRLKEMSPDLPNLKQTIPEITITGEFFEKDQRVLLLDETATKANLKLVTEGKDYFLMSFATHAVKNINNRGKTVLVLQGEKNIESYFLLPEEIIEFGISAENVFLSACSTYEVANTEFGLDDTLVASFLMNGTRSVLTSNIPVEDKATKKLTTLITKNLVSKLSKNLSAAYRDAIIAMLESNYRAPKYWAGFRAIGE